MVRCLSSRWGVVVVVAALSAGGAGLVEAETSIDVRDVYPECRGVLDNIGEEKEGGYAHTAAVVSFLLPPRDVHRRRMESRLSAAVALHIQNSVVLFLSLCRSTVRYSRHA